MEFDAGSQTRRREQQSALFFRNRPLDYFKTERKQT